MPFSVDLSVFRGPLDLLLYLVRKHEVDILDIPIAPITDQYLAHLAVLQSLDVDAVGDFLEMASWLLEIKSRMILPRGDEVEDELEDPRQELVQKLLEYKKYRDAASMLDERGRAWHDRFSRAANDLVARVRDPSEEPIHEVELWDLVSAFGRIIRDTSMVRPSSIVYDETPIHVYMQRIKSQLESQPRLAFSTLFTSGMHKSSLVGIFLAVLELMRHHQVRADQNDLFGEIWLALDPTAAAADLDLSQIDNYEHRSTAETQG